MTSSVELIMTSPPSKKMKTSTQRINLSRNSDCVIVEPKAKEKTVQYNFSQISNEFLKHIFMQKESASEGSGCLFSTKQQISLNCGITMKQTI